MLFAVSQIALYSCECVGDDNNMKLSLCVLTCWKLDCNNEKLQKQTTVLLHSSVS